MALGNTNNMESDHKLFILKIKNKVVDNDTKKETLCMPHVFQILEKSDGKWVAKTDTITTFSGTLTKIDCEVDSWEDTEYNVIKLKFVDNEAKEDYLLDARCSSDFRSLANSILNLDPKNTANLKVSMYKTTSKTNGKEYSNVSLWQGDSHIKGKFSWDELPAVEKVKFKGKDMSDTSKLDEFIISNLKGFAAELEKAQKSNKSDKPAAPKPQVVEDQEVPTGLSDDEIPF